VPISSKLDTNPAKRSLAAVDPQRFLYAFEIDREAGERYLPEDNIASEQREYQRLIDLFSAHFKNKYGDASARESHKDQGETGYALRGVHAKGHGCLAGTFSVDPHGHAEFQYGIFKEPKTYNIVVRYSNGDGPPQSDVNNTVSIGMAFKLLDVKEEKLLGAQQTEDSVDFLMTNHSNFIVRDIREFAEVIEGREGGLLDKIGAVKVAAKGLYQRLKVEKKDPLATSYWSNLPFKMGEGVVKYLLRPESCPGESDTGEVLITRPMHWTPNFLADTLAKHIRHHSACFGFYLQKRGSDKESPVEDASVSWPEKGLVTRVGTLQIPSQEPNENLALISSLAVEGLSGKQICQNLSFSPWNTTTDFKPLSSLNRARRVIYELSAAMRRDINHSTNPAERKR
jgi:hypothetical protein